MIGLEAVKFYFYEWHISSYFLILNLSIWTWYSNFLF